MPKFLVSLLGIRLSGKAMDFFSDVVIETMKMRETGQKRGDFLDMMMEQREEQKNLDAATPKYRE